MASKTLERPPGDVDHAKADEALARRLAIPDRFEDGEVPVVDHEETEHDGGEKPGTGLGGREARGKGAEADAARRARGRQPIWTSVSIASARKRLPTPASGNSSAICSGVSMVSFSSAGTALSARWIEKRKPHWARLEALVAACGRRSVARSLTRNSASWRYCIVRRRPTSRPRERTRRAPPLARYLNQLLGRAHNLVYAGAARSRHRRVRTFLLDGFPQVSARRWQLHRGRRCLFLAGGCLRRADCRARSRLRALHARRPDDGHHRAPRDVDARHRLPIKPLASSAIMTNNIAVSLAAFATGMLAGVGTVYMMLFNGLLHRRRRRPPVIAPEMSLALWSFVAPHGALELPAIFIAGGAGLILGKGLVVPGTLPRREFGRGSGPRRCSPAARRHPAARHRRRRSRASSRRPSTPVIAKFAIGASLFVLLALYLSRGWRRSSRQPQPTTRSLP